MDPELMQKSCEVFGNLLEEMYENGEHETVVRLPVVDIEGNRLVVGLHVCVLFMEEDKGGLH